MRRNHISQVSRKPGPPQGVIGFRCAIIRLLKYTFEQTVMCQDVRAGQDFQNTPCSAVR